MGQHHDKIFPGEDAAYRVARDQLLTAEIALRQQIEDVAALRRQLPAGGPIADDYIFDELSDDGSAEQVKLSGLFADGKPSVVIYSYMFGPEAEAPCPMCTSISDSLNGAAPHIGDRVNFALVAKAPVEKFRNWGDMRDWKNLRLLSSQGNSYNADYFAEDAEGSQWPMINVFQKSDNGIRHFWGSELFYADVGEGQHPRHADQLWPLWATLDLTPEGRGTDWYPKYRYD